MKYIISRAINGTSLNGDEYIMEADGKTEKLFDTEESALQFLAENGVVDAIEKDEVHIKGYNEVTKEIYFL